MTAAHAAPLDEPAQAMHDPLKLLLGYLDYYRDTSIRKIDGLTESQLRSTLVPSGWTPLALVQHLAFMERRWLQWGFAGKQVADPWGDDDPDTKRWAVRDDVVTADVVANLRAVGVRTRELVTGHELTDLGATGGRFHPDTEPPSLSWILLHVLQEYARHVGHLDIVRELADGSVGE